MKSIPSLFLTALLGLGLTTAALADELRLEDGSTISGQVTQWNTDSVTIGTSFAGDLTIDRKLITAVTADENVVVHVKSGDRIIGKLQYDKDKGQLLTGTTFGDLLVDMSQVQSIYLPGQEPVTEQFTPAPAQASTTQAAAPAAPEGDPAASASPTAAAGAGSTAVPAFTPANPAMPVGSKWTARIELGADGQTGNTERLSARGRAEARRTTENDRLLFYFQGTYAKQNGARSANEIMGGAEIEVDITKRLFAFGKGSLEFDEFENLDLRAMVSAGLGYFWIREDDQHLKTRGGIGYMHESFDTGVTEDTAILELGVDYMKQISPWLLYNHSTTYYPTLSSLSDFRIVMENSAEIPITKDKDWKVRLGIKNEYDSAPEPGIERLDTTYFANLVWDFK